MTSLRQIGIMIAVAGVIAALYMGMHAPRRHASRTHQAELADAPTLTFADLNGRPLNTADLKGKVVLVNFWAAWCTPCADEVPKLMGLQDKYAARGFQTIGISMEDKDAALRAFYRKHNMNYPVVVGNDKIAEEYGGILGLPTTLLVDRNGRIRYKHSGLADFSALEQEVTALLRVPN